MNTNLNKNIRYSFWWLAINWNAIFKAIYSRRSNITFLLRPFPLYHTLSHSFLGGRNPPFQNLLPLFKDFPLFDNFSTPLFCDILWTWYFATFCTREGVFLSNIELAMFMHRHSLNSNEPKNSWISLTSTMVGENFEIWSLQMSWKALIEVTWC